jgi:phosphatidylserine decarboxylase
MFHKEGYKILLSGLLLVVLINLGAMYTIAGEYPMLQKYLLLVSLVLYVLIVQFFRNPKRYTTANDELVYSSVDGKVVVIEEVEEPEFFKDKRIMVSVFMSPLNVHVTRYPIGGNIVFSKYHPGKYLAAWLPKASTDNERTTVVVENNNKKQVLFRQIAGAMAKRIVNYAKAGEEAIQGADSGFIKFGSRVDIYLPLDAKVKVNLDQKVRGGETVIAEF